MESIMVFLAVQTLVYLLEAINAIITNIFGTSVHSTCHLYQNVIAPTPTTPLASYTEATFDGYAPISITAWGTPHVIANGQYAVAPTTPLVWTPTGSTTSNTVYGYYIKDPAGNVIQAENFAAGQLMSGTGTTLQFVPEVAIGPGITTAQLVP
jgi:hypothetical protein